MTIDIFLDDCVKVLKKLKKNSISVIITDPPYPDYFADEYLYFDGILEPLKEFQCRQIIFWSAKAEFPLDYSAIHIWDKARGIGNQYERIFERNGKDLYTVFRGQKIHNQIDAVVNKDVLTDHPSQKPIRLMIALLKSFTQAGDTILDPFMGSGSTGIACIKTGRNFVGIEKNKKHFETAKKRIKKEQLQMSFFTEQIEKSKDNNLSMF